MLERFEELRRRIPWCLGCFLRVPMIEKANNGGHRATFLKAPRVFGYSALVTLLSVRIVDNKHAQKSVGKL